MKTITLGKTNIKITKNGFGALPIQRDSEEEAVYLMKKAYKNGMNFFDTARAYTDSESKISKFLKDVPREKVIIASKTMATNVEDFWKDLETSLEELATDYIDLYQLHNPSFCPKPEDESGIYEALLEAKEKGLIKHIGFTSHKFEIANEAIDSGLYETLQFPFSFLTGEKELELVKKCEEKNIGFIAMKAMSGGLIKSSKAAYTFLDQYDNVVPIWGIQRESELDEFIEYMNNSPVLDDELKETIANEKEELAGDFCRGCGYCMPCPEEINIFSCARMSLWIRRFPSKPSLTEESQEMMKKIENCTECKACIAKCPYDLNIPELLKKNYEDYKNILSGKTNV